MRRVLVGFVLLAGAACQLPPSELTPTHATAARDSIVEMMARFQRYSREAAWDSLSTLYSQDSAFRFLESGRIQYQNAEAVRAALQSIPVGNRLETSYDDIAILPLAPGLAAVSGLFKTAFVDTTGTRFSISGAVSILWRHEVPGWRILGGHTSALVPRSP